MNLVGLGKLLFQLGDYAVKAVIHFANTEDGAKEWGDVVAAFVELDLFNPSDVAQDVTVSKAGGESDGFTLDDIERLSREFNTSGEHVSEARTASPRVAHRQHKGTPNPSNVERHPF